MDMPETMMSCGVQFDQRLVGTKYISIIKRTVRTIAAAYIADVCERCKELRPRRQLLFIGRFHILCAPTEMPDGGSEIGKRRLLDFGEKHPRFLRPDTIHQACKTPFFA